MKRGPALALALLTLGIGPFAGAQGKPSASHPLAAASRRRASFPTVDLNEGAKSVRVVIRRNGYRPTQDLTFLLVSSTGTPVAARIAAGKPSTTATVASRALPRVFMHRLDGRRPHGGLGIAGLGRDLDWLDDWISLGAGAGAGTIAWPTDPNDTTPVNAGNEPILGAIFTPTVDGTPLTVTLMDAGSYNLTNVVALIQPDASKLDFNVLKSVPLVVGDVAGLPNQSKLNLDAQNNVVSATFKFNRSLTEDKIYVVILYDTVNKRRIGNTCYKIIHKMVAR